MTNPTRLLLFASILILLPIASHAKGADGAVLLNGIIQNASASKDVVSFAFTGKLSFAFYTAAPGDPARKRIDLAFDVTRLPIRIEKFGTTEYDNEYCPFRLTYKNAAANALEASDTGEIVSISLFRPTLSYGADAIIKDIESRPAQVLPDRLDHEMRVHGMPASCTAR